MIDLWGWRSVMSDHLQGRDEVKGMCVDVLRNIRRLSCNPHFPADPRNDVIVSSRAAPRYGFCFLRYSISADRNMS